MTQDNNDNPPFICTDLSFKIESFSIPVSSIVIDLEEASIPRVFLTISPNTILFNQSKIQKAEFSQFTDLFTRLQNAINKPQVSASVDFVLVRKGKPAVDLHLRGWKVVSAGIKNVSASGSFSIEVEIQHPATVLTRSVSAIGNIIDANYSMTMILSLLNSQNVLDSLKRGYEVYARAVRMQPLPVSAASSSIDAGVSAAFYAGLVALEKSSVALNQHLVWSGQLPDGSSYSGFPTAQGALSSYLDTMKMAVGNYVMSIESDLWSMLKNIFLPSWFLTIIPTYWKESLEVTPFSPWAKPTILVNDSLCSELNIPGVSASQIAGVRASLSDGSGSLLYTFASRDEVSEAQKNLSEIIFIPTNSIRNSQLCGSLITMSLPEWIQEMLKFLGNKSSSANTPIDNENTARNGSNTEGISGSEGPVGSAPMPKPILLDFTKAIYLCAMQMYLSLYKEHAEVSFVTPLLIQTPYSKKDSYTVPGCVARLVSFEKGRVLLDTYITRIRHVYSIDSGQAYTTWHGTYCRSLETQNEIPSGTLNPLYSN